jgi:hypothetical protein
LFQSFFVFLSKIFHTSYCIRMALSKQHVITSSGIKLLFTSDPALG